MATDEVWFRDPAPVRAREDEGRENELREIDRRMSYSNVVNPSWFSGLDYDTREEMTQAGAQVQESFGARFVSVRAGQYTPDGARTLANQLLNLANEAEKNPELDALVMLLEEAEFDYESTWSDIAEAVYNAGYRKTGNE